MSHPTPCIGVCSTTVGDTICRGCKRTVSEIRDWQMIDRAEQERIWQRVLSQPTVDIRHQRRAAKSGIQCSG